MSRAPRGSARGKILHAAAALFANQGYTGTSMDDIAAAAGVSKGSIFYHFATKEELFTGFVVAAAEAMGSGIGEARAGLRGWEALSAVAEAVLARVDAYSDEAGILVSEMFRAGRPWGKEIGEARATILRPITEVLAEISDDRAAAGASHAPDGAGFDDLGAAVMGALAFAALDRRTYAPDRDLADVHSRLMMTLSGLVAA